MQYEHCHVGLWVDCPPKTVLSHGYFRAVKDLGISELAIMLDDAPRRWRPRWSLTDWEALCRMAERYGISLAITTWPYPDKRLLDTMYASLEDYLSASTCILGEESDTEFNWKASKTKGFRGSWIAGRDRVSAFDAACEYLVAKKRDCAFEAGVRRGRAFFPDDPGYCDPPFVEQTTFAGHSEAGVHAKVAPHMDAMFLQMYSVAHRQRRNSAGEKVQYAVPWGHTYGPGSMQKWSIERARLIPGVQSRKVALGAGLAVWDQEFSGHTIGEALDAAFIQTIIMGVRRIRLWSSKWLIGARSDTQRQRAVREHVGKIISRLNKFSIVDYEGEATIIKAGGEGSDSA